SFVPLFVFLAPLMAGVQLFYTPSRSSEGQSATAAGVSHEQVVLGDLRARLGEARGALEVSQPETTDAVRLAVEDGGGAALHLVDVPKEIYLAKGAEAVLTSSLGEPLRLRVVRANGVNTAVRVTDGAGRELRPLVVQYPIEREGRMEEVAYYSSAHPALSSDALTRGGSIYVRGMLDRAAARLREKGKTISPEIVDVAERLCVVEHTDHKRFKAEDRARLFDEIYALYALNAGDTYRYSVSSAGAGGMIQMIPPTYAAMRERHAVGLKSDFVEGMRDHANATEAMLLYMQDTWDKLLQSEEVRAALASKTATQAELLAAGYNSNPLRLPGYLKRGGDRWRTLIPSETQMYLQIYSSVERLAFKQNG
ncbi:MAG TPA: hypothetical protein VFX96_10060, partial [Pyrinomonadaceae bacterium]|nr:hypothetical protein [Pyrinomonadaceae bacterium]